MVKEENAKMCINGCNFFLCFTDTKLFISLSHIRNPIKDGTQNSDSPHATARLVFKSRIQSSSTAEDCLLSLNQFSVIWLKSICFL